MYFEGFYQCILKLSGVILEIKGSVRQKYKRTLFPYKNNK